MKDPKPIRTGGPPEPTEDRPVSIALHDALQKIADLTLELHELTRRFNKHMKDSNPHGIL